MTYLFDLVLIGMSIYVLIGGITGRGRLFEIDNLKEGMEEKFDKGARKLYLALGVAMLLNSVSSLLLTELYGYDESYQLTVPLYDLGKWDFLTPTVFKTVSYVALACMIGLLITLGIFMSKMTDRNAPPKKREERKSSRSSGKREPVVLPAHAFEFDLEQEQPAETEQNN